jgi:uncharacterized membrane protein
MNSDSMKEKRRIMIVVVIISLSIIATCLVFYFITKSNLWLAGIIFTYLITLIFSRSFWKCPKCNKFLGKGWSKKECPHCHFILIQN